MGYAHVSPEAGEKLAEELNTATEIRWYRRLRVIQLSAQRQPVSLIATFLDLCPATVRAYIIRYNAHGLTGLQREASPGAPPKLPVTKAEWEDLLHQSPAHFERLQTGARNWTQALLQAYFREYHQVTVTQPAISATIKRQGIRWNRGKLKVTSPDPLYTVKRDRIDTLKKKPPLAR
jgi:transposase